MTEPFVQHGNQLLIDRWMKHLPDLSAGFTTRLGGVSTGHYESNNLGLHTDDDPERIIANRYSTASETNTDLKQWVFADQTHEDQIVKVPRALAGSGSLDYDDTIKRTDGFYTDEPGVMLSLGFADCVPLYFIHEGKKLAGTAHAGWKGTVRNIGGKMVRLWSEFEGVPAGEIYAAIGPSVGSCCYQVDQKVIDELQKVLADFEPYSKNEDGTYQLQLKEANRLLLIQEGIPPENIHVSSCCTSCSEELFFSHRRDKGLTGRMHSFIGFTR